MGIELDLELPDVEILKVSRDSKGNYVIELHSTNKSGVCRKCGKEIRHFKGYDEWITIRHLPILGREVYLKIRPRRYQCLECDNEPTTTERFSWRSSGKSYTKAYQDHVLRCLISSSVEDVCLKEKLGEKQVEAMLSESCFGKNPLDHISYIGTLGLDEIALKKGHRDFVAIASSHYEGRTQLVGVLPDRKKETVCKFLKLIPDALKTTIDDVATDMYEGYLNAAKEALGESVEIVVDRFHVAQSYRKSADSIRKQEQKRLKKELSEDDYKQMKGLLWAFRKNPDKLTETETGILEIAFGYSPDLKEAYQLRNAMTDIFEEPYTKQEAITAFSEWEEKVIQSGLNCYDSFLNTLNSFQSQIANYFNNRCNSGFVEGFNNKIKVIKRRCYGIFNIKHLMQRILLDTLGPKLIITK